MAYANKFPVSMKKGGFPDLTGDGKVTKKDILRGRGVLKKGGSMMKTAGKTTTGVISDYRGYTGKKQLGGIKKAIGTAKKVTRAVKKVANKIGSKKMY